MQEIWLTAKNRSFYTMFGLNNQVFPNALIFLVSPPVKCYHYDVYVKQKHKHVTVPRANKCRLDPIWHIVKHIHHPSKFLPVLIKWLPNTERIQSSGLIAGLGCCWLRWDILCMPVFTNVRQFVCQREQQVFRGATIKLLRLSEYEESCHKTSHNTFFILCRGRWDLIACQRSKCWMIYYLWEVIIFFGDQNGLDILQKQFSVEPSSCIFIGFSSNSFSNCTIQPSVL